MSLSNKHIIRGSRAQTHMLSVCAFCVYADYATVFNTILQLLLLLKPCHSILFLMFSFHYTSIFIHSFFLFNLFFALKIIFCANEFFVFHSFHSRELAILIGMYPHSTYIYICIDNRHMVHMYICICIYNTQNSMYRFIFILCSHSYGLLNGKNPPRDRRMKSE